MVNNETAAYINAELTKGVGVENITASLVKVGWSQADAENAIAAVQSENTSHNVATEHVYPIAKRWLFKSSLIIIIISIVGLFFGVWFPDLVLLFPILLIANTLIRYNFHYATQEKIFQVRQGVFSKNNRSFPYGVIQNVIVKQDLFDRIFGLATLRIENASVGGGKGSLSGGEQLRDLYIARTGDVVGSSGNKVNIPGMRKKDAESLKQILLQKMKQNPIEDSQSGL